tara:strand:- start:1285 stop:2247 length:963 start_codon:yes stop_codon:yes gene_type:complete
MVNKQNKKYDIVGMGNAIVDLIAEVDDSYLEKNNISKGTMSLVDYNVINKIGTEVNIISTISGGSVANSIVCIAQNNLKAAFIGKVKDDTMGVKFAEGLAKENVHFQISQSPTNNYTGRCLILVSPDAERTMNTYLGISQELTEQDIDMKIIEESSMLYLEGYLWDLDNAKKAIRKAIDTARRSNAIVAFSISDQFCVDRFREEFLQIIYNHADIIFANESEIKSLFETNNLESAIKECQNTNKIFALTLGEKGAKIVNNSEIIDINPENIENLVDTTGAGDLFAAGFLSKFLNSNNLRVCGEEGVRLASVIIQKFGARI